jgi:hypothetical protein
VVPPEFVARGDEGGAYGLREMPKRFVHGYVADKGRAFSDEVRAMELDDAQLTAKILRVTTHELWQSRRPDDACQGSRPCRRRRHCCFGRAQRIIRVLGEVAKTILRAPL